MNDNFKPIGEIAKDVLNKITKERVKQLTNRHIAIALSELDYLTESEKESIKKQFRNYERNVLTQLFGINGDENEQIF